MGCWVSTGGDSCLTLRRNTDHSSHQPPALPRDTNVPLCSPPAGGTLPPTFTQRRRTNGTARSSTLATPLRKHRGISTSTATVTATGAAERDQRPPSTISKTRSLPLSVNYKGPSVSSRVNSSVRRPPRKRPRTSLSVLRNGTVSEVQAGPSALLPRGRNTPANRSSFQGPHRGDFAGEKEWARTGSAVTSTPHTCGGFSEVGRRETRSI